MSADGRSKAARPARAKDRKVRGILLIEDEPLVMATIEYALGAAGYKVKSSSHGTDALRLFKLLDPDLVITDVIMPEIDTLDAIQEFRRLRPATEIIAISGNPHLLSLAMEHGARHALLKPFNAAQLTALVKAVLG